MYRHSATARGFDVVAVPLDADWDIDVAATVSAIERTRPNVVFLASPNNPTAGQLSDDRIEAVVRAAPDTLVILDEAYVAYAARTQRGIRQSPNVAVMGTISKVGLAALRIGWLIAPSAFVRELDKVRQPFNIPAPSMHAATVLLRELGPEIARVRAAVVEERERLAAGLRTRGFRVARSDANFLWVDTGRCAADIVRSLAAAGVAVK